MSKGTTHRTVGWKILLRGLLITLSLYLLAILLLALLMVRGIIPQSAPVLPVICLLSSLAGSLYTVRRMSWGALPTALVSGGIFAAVLLLGGLCMQQGIGAQGIPLLLCALGGALAAALLGKRKLRRKKRK